MTIDDIRAAIAAEGGIRAAARALNIPESTIRYRLQRASETRAKPSDDKYMFVSTKMPEPLRFDPLPDHTRYFILATAQDATDIHHDFVKALHVYAEDLENCEIIFSGCTYNKKLFETHDKISDGIFYHPDIAQYIIHGRVEIGDQLVFCGEMNTLPTAKKPLSGFRTYTRRKWGIFPHVKVQLESVPTQKNALTKQIMTTGAVTMPNYVRKKAGIQAQFDHIVGAVLVALKPDGSFWCRHIQAESDTDGSFYDLDCYVTSEGVTDGHRVAGITYGDVHHEKVDPAVAMATWGYDPETQVRFVNAPCVINFLRPEFEFFHDISDFSPRNHHNIKDHHFHLKTRINRCDNVEEALRGVATFLNVMERPECQSCVVISNHDNALVTWIKTVGEKVKFDTTNYEFFLETELAYVRGIRETGKEPPIFEQTLRRFGSPGSIEFLGEDSTFMVCGVECAMHGHLGANGAKASPNAFEQMGEKSNTGHVHSPGITSGNYRSGVCSLELGYNKGLSSWCITHTVIYPNGKRTLITYMNGSFYE